MTNEFVRVANAEDLHLITAYFEQALAHYEASGQLIAMQDIKYFLQNMETFNFFVKKETALEITYLFEFPPVAGGTRETGVIAIPLQNN